MEFVVDKVTLGEATFRAPCLYAVNYHQTNFKNDSNIAPF